MRGKVLRVLLRDARDCDDVVTTRNSLWVVILGGGVHEVYHEGQHVPVCCIPLVFGNTFVRRLSIFHWFLPLEGKLYGV